MSARKLQAWIAKIKLTSGPDRNPAGSGEGQEEVKAAAAEESGEEGGEGGAGEEKKSSVNLDGEDTIDQIAAVVRIKIPKVDPVFEQDEEGNDIVVEVNESELEDVPFEDKCLTLQAKQEDQNIWVINHLVQKTLRQEISAEFRQMVDRLDNLDTQDFNFRLEKEADAFEDLFLKLVEDIPSNKVKAPKVPVFDFRPKY